MDTKDLKGFLYGWLGKQKIGAPVYNITTVTRGGTQRFKCELRVPGHSYVGMGNSLNKKVELRKISLRSFFSKAAFSRMAHRKFDA